MGEGKAQATSWTRRRFQPNWITQCNGITDLEYMTMEEKTAQVVGLRLQSNYRNVHIYGGLDTLKYNILKKILCCA